MKKIKLIFIITLAHLLICTSLMAQAPQSFEYQAVVRDASNNILASQPVGIQITLKQGSASGTNTYQETFTTNTNLYGLVNLQIGTGTTGDDFSTIDWANGPYFIEVALDITGGTTYSIMGASQLLSVPYALHAKTVEIDNVDDADNDPTNEIELPATANVGDVLTWDGSNWIASPKSGGKTYIMLSGGITDLQAATKIANELGSNTQFIYVQNTTNLTTLDLSAVTELIEISITNNTNLSSVDLSGLTETFWGINFDSNPNLSTVLLNTLAQTGSNFMFTNNPQVSSLNLSNLVTTKDGIFTISNCNNLGNLNISTLQQIGSLTIFNTLLSNLTLSSLAAIGTNYGATITIENNPSLVGVDFSALTTMHINNNNISINNNASLSSISFPNLNTEVMVLAFSNNALTTIVHPNLKPTMLYNVIGNNLSSSTINGLLNYFVNIAPILNSVDFQFGNQTPPAPPTGQGITDKNTLISNGNNVITD